MSSTSFRFSWSNVKVFGLPFCIELYNHLQYTFYFPVLVFHILMVIIPRLKGPPVRPPTSGDHRETLPSLLRWNILFSLILLLYKRLRYKNQNFCEQRERNYKRSKDQLDLQQKQDLFPLHLDKQG